jgi:hypothetical protein
MRDRLLLSSVGLSQQEAMCCPVLRQPDPFACRGAFDTAEVVADI